MMTRIKRGALAGHACAFDGQNFASGGDGDVVLAREDLKEPTVGGVQNQNAVEELMTQCVTMLVGLSEMPRAKTIGQAVRVGRQPRL